jgi:hypothetical protein
MEVLVVASKENGPAVNASPVSWSCLNIRMQDQVTT